MNKKLHWVDEGSRWVLTDGGRILARIRPGMHHGWDANIGPYYADEYIGWYSTLDLAKEAARQIVGRRLLEWADREV